MQRNVFASLTLLVVLLIAHHSPTMAGPPVPQPSHGTDVQQCDWSDAFHVSGPNGTLYASIVYDDGSGSALYVAGNFDTVDRAEIHGVAKWDGTTWSAVGAGFEGDVFALAIYDDGSGPALYAGGNFNYLGPSTRANPPPFQNIAKWDGTTWSDPGTSGVFFGTVYALAVFDDGSGPRLAAGGDFGDIGNADAESIAAWNGTQWQTLGTGTNSGGAVLSLATNGGTLYAAGVFSSMNGVAISDLAAWDGSSWSAVGDAGFSFLDVHQLAVYDDGDGPDLYAAGGRPTIGGVEIGNRVARWDGTSWAAIGDGFGDLEPTGLAIHDDGTGAVLMASSFYDGGNQNERILAHRLASWDGTTWTDEVAGLATGVYTMATFDSGSGPRLIVGGAHAIGEQVSSIMERQLDGSWTPVTGQPGGLGIDDRVVAFATFDDGSGSAVYAAGWFRGAGGVAAYSVARWRNGRWEAVGDGLDDGLVNDLVVYDDGSGPALYAGGFFRIGTDGPIHYLARWDGIAWSPIAGIDVQIAELAVFDDGGGALLVADIVLPAGGAMVDRIQTWDGTTWTSIATGIDDTVSDLIAFDDGSGPALYAIGRFTNAGAGAAQHVARWDGTNWSAVGAGVPIGAAAAAVYDDGSGARLFVFGNFTDDPSLTAWDGTSWSPVFLPPGPERASGLATVDLGEGPALYVGGWSSAFDFTITSYVFRKTSAGWETLDIDGNRSVQAFAHLDDPDFSGLLAGGLTTAAGSHVSSRVALATSCTSSILLADGFETGTLDAWLVVQ